MMWPQLDFFPGNIHNFAFLYKKNSNSEIFYTWVSVAS